jgi:lactate dehydrogenase-like 2-hydroxyacid dehydrogenase
MKPDIIICVHHAPEELDIFRQQFTVHFAPTPEELAATVAAKGQLIRGAVTTGFYGLKGEYIFAMPNLEVICARGDIDNVDFDTARQRGISVCGIHSSTPFRVAEHAMAILLSIVRRVPFDDAGVHRGEWRKHRMLPLRPLIYQKRMGILGLGAVGAAIAQRALGFEMTIAYHNRNRRDDVPYTYVDTVLKLAEDSDILMISAPGEPDTRGLVSREVIDALGPKGYLVNVGRGSIVDQVALVDALENGRIAGAALDVVDGEPDEIPAALLRAPNLVITPHIAGGAPETRSVCEHLQAKLYGRPPGNRRI